MEYGQMMIVWTISEENEGHDVVFRAKSWNTDIQDREITVPMRKCFSQMCMLGDKYNQRGIGVGFDTE